MNSKESKTTRFLNISEIIGVLRDNILILFIWGVIGVLGGLLVAIFFVSPKYESSVDVLVNQKVDNTQAQYNAQQADLQAINTYKDVLKKPVILQPTLKQIKEENNYKGTIEDLQGAISISNQSESQVISISVKANNPYLASDIANDVAKIFNKKIKGIMKVNNVTIVSDAKPEMKPVFPNKLIFILLGGVITTGLAYMIVLFKFLNDTTVKDSKFLTDELGLTSLGFVYHIDNKDSNFEAVSVEHKHINSSTQMSRRRV